MRSDDEAGHRASSRRRRRKRELLSLLIFEFIAFTVGGALSFMQIGAYTLHRPPGATARDLRNGALVGFVVFIIEGTRDWLANRSS